MAVVYVPAMPTGPLPVVLLDDPEEPSHRPIVHHSHQRRTVSKVPDSHGSPSSVADGTEPISPAHDERNPWKKAPSESLPVGVFFLPRRLRHDQVVPFYDVGARSLPATGALARTILQSFTVAGHSFLV